MIYKKIIFRALGILELWIRALWTIAARCNCFFLMLLLDVVQSTFKKITFLWVRQSGCPSHLSSLSCRKSVFLLCSTVKEKIRGKFIFGLPSGCLSGCWWTLVPQWSQHSSQPPSLLAPLLVPAWRIRWHCSLLLTTLVWPSTNGFLNGDECICSPSEHLKRFWTLNRL